MKSVINEQIVDRNQIGTYILLEAGPTHTGYDSAIKLIDLAKQNGANAIKFQYLNADRLMADKKINFAYSYLQIDENNKEVFVPYEESLYDILKRRELTKDEWKAIKQHCDAIGITFISTATFEDEVDFLLDELKVGSIKLASSDINNLPFIKYCAKKCHENNTNFQMDTGNADLWEIERAVITAEEMGCENIIIHHCPSGYPARLPSINLNMIKTLKIMFPEYAIAFSDHTQGWDMDIAAIALGADLVEKTITMDRTIKSCEHSFSLSPGMVQDFIQAVRNVDIALGSTRRVIPQTEKQKRKTGRRSPYAALDLKAGDIITEDMFELRRPEAGASVLEFTNMLGRKLAKDIAKDECLSATHV